MTTAKDLVDGVDGTELWMSNPTRGQNDEVYGCEARLLSDRYHLCRQKKQRSASDIEMDVTQCHAPAPKLRLKLGVGGASWFAIRYPFL